MKDSMLRDDYVLTCTEDEIKIINESLGKLPGLAASKLKSRIKNARSLRSRLTGNPTLRLLDWFKLQGSDGGTAPEFAAATLTGSPAARKIIWGQYTLGELWKIGTRKLVPDGQAYTLYVHHSFLGDNEDENQKSNNNGKDGKGHASQNEQEPPRQEKSSKEIRRRHVER